jgi:hypothetical protein
MSSREAACQYKSPHFQFPPLDEQSISASFLTQNKGGTNKDPCRDSNIRNHRHQSVETRHINRESGGDRERLLLLQNESQNRIQTLFEIKDDAHEHDEMIVLFSWKTIITRIKDANNRNQTHRQTALANRARKTNCGAVHSRL